MGSLIGVDEVGRGCWAGPLLVVAARATAELPRGLKDSKLLSRSQREEILNHLVDCCEFGEGWIKSIEIDSYGLAKALRLGVRRALHNLQARIDEEIVMDGKVNYLPKKFVNGSCLVDADDLVPIVSAASIYAKVTRDRFMNELSKKYPLYSFDKHVGYGTPEHRAALREFGVIRSVHRFSYAPIARMAL
ncbi:MAG TPA: ribonuclease HII [Candidatus Saccharimonadales bacterium]|nr:ribonuclease HII [Candidatus Saccharimonadales bacterium]